MRTGNDDQKAKLENELTKLNDEQYHEHLILKTIKLYDGQVDIVREILVEEVTSYKNRNYICDGSRTDASYDTSTLTRNGCLYYFKRFYNAVNNGKSFLQLYKCDMPRNFAEEKVETKSGKTYIYHEDMNSDKLSRKQFNSIFSKQIDPRGDCDCETEE